MGVGCCYDDDDAAADVVEPLGNTNWGGRRYANLIRGFVWPLIIYALYWICG